MEFFAGWMIGIMTAMAFAGFMVFGIWMTQKLESVEPGVLPDGEMTADELFAKLPINQEV